MDLSEPFPTAQARSPATPVLRTVLLCDIVDSTAMVERLGDQRAATLLQRHDVMLRQLVTLCHGQLIDKADGVLAVFERPIQALDFALRYQRGLLDIGRDDGIALKARIGMHVGDVMMWANEPRDVLAGAKAFEIEGLAKPVAGRLMGLALPGQILMSGMAQNLCQRAAGELGDAGAKLRWLLHGRYRFKGVPAPMLVHEVGEPGLSPLRAPDSGNKAWRELPLWRRPPVVALELLVLGTLLVGGIATMLRSPPAIAFAERDWVVVADLQNRTAEPLFDDALDTALLIGLEQSRHVNVISQLQIDRALERMQRQGQPVDRQLATELALREGARAVILPTVAQVGGAVRVSLEVIDPRSGVTVYSESADGKGTDDVLPALDRTIASIRGKLGDALTGVENPRQRLENVTTGDLEALKAYSLAQQARYEGRAADSEPLYREAVRLDPTFAMAYLRLAFLRYIENDADGTRRWLDKAVANRGQLGQREALFLDGAAATLDDPATALQHFRTLAALYPDEYRAYYNYAYFAHFDLLRSADGMAMLPPALEAQNPQRAFATYLAGSMALALDQPQDAIAYFEKAELLGVVNRRREHAEAYLALGRPDAAARVVARQRGEGSLSMDLDARLIEVTMPLDRGQYEQAVRIARALESEAATAGPGNHRMYQLIALSLRAYAPDAAFREDLRRFAADLPELLAGADTLARRHLLFDVLGASWMAAYTGDVALAARLRALTDDDPLVAAYPANAAMRRIVDAEIALANGDAAGAAALLADDTRSEDAGLYFSRAVQMRAQAAAGNATAAMALAEWLTTHRGRAFGEPNSRSTWQPANVLESTLALSDWARFAEARGDTASAERQRKAFADAWPDGSGAMLVEQRVRRR